MHGGGGGGVRGEGVWHFISASSKLNYSRLSLSLNAKGLNPATPSIGENKLFEQKSSNSYQTILLSYFLDPEVQRALHMLILSPIYYR